MKELKDICVVKGEYGGGFSAVEYFEGAPRYIRITDINEEGTLNPEIKAPSGEPEEWERYTLSDGDLLFARSGATVGKTFLYSSDYGNCIYAGYLIKFTPDQSKVHPKYLYYFTKSPRYTNWVIAQQRVVAQPNINAKQYGALTIPLPPLSEQRRIAEVLDGADALRRLDRELVGRYDALVQSVFYDMFGDPVKNEKGWEVRKLGEVVTMVGSGSTPRGGESVYSNEGYLFIRSQNVRDNIVDMNGIFYIPESIHHQMKRTWVQHEDVLLNITGASIGRAAIFYGQSNSANVNQHVCIIRLNQEQMSPRFLLHHLTKDSYQQRIIGQNSGGTREAFNFKQIRDFNVILPPLSLQQRFAEVVQGIESQKAVAEAGLRRSEELMGSLMAEVWG